MKISYDWGLWWLQKTESFLCMNPYFFEVRFTTWELVWPKDFSGKTQWWKRPRVAKDIFNGGFSSKLFNEPKAN